MKNSKKAAAVETIEMNHVKIVSGRTGGSTKVFVDGKLLGNCLSANFYAEARGLNVLTLRILPKSVQIHGEVKVTETVVPSKKLLSK